MKNGDCTNRSDGKIAILVDGGFYRRRAFDAFGDVNPEERAKELINYCNRHLKENHVQHDLYRIFYYDCPPMEKVLMHPLTRKNVDFKKTKDFAWANAFHNELKQKRKVALRFGKLSDAQAKFVLKKDAMKKIFTESGVNTDSICEDDFVLEVKQKGVDMRIGLDIASLSYKKQVTQIVLISGDSDFVSAAKLARREGIDFVLDPLGAKVKPDLFEHIDGLRCCDKKFKIRK